MDREVNGKDTGKIELENIINCLTPFYISNADYFYKKLNIVYINNLNTNNKII